MTHLTPDTSHLTPGTSTLERFVTAALVLGLAAEQQGDRFGLSRALKAGHRIDAN